MPRVKIDYVVSFSNEDPENQANNLLSWEVSKKKWLCSKGESSCSVVLQLAKAVKISSVQIGAHCAALVEVLVGRSETPSEPFQVAVPRSVFLSPAQSRAAEGAGGAGGGRVRSFDGAALAAAALAQRWDRVRVLCSQPYNKHCKYGLSFIHIFEPEGESGPAPTPSPTPAPAPAPAVPIRLFAWDTFSSDEEDFRPGELFAKHRQSGGDTGSQIRQATLQALKNNPDAATKLMKTSLTMNKPTTSSEHAEPRDRRRDKDDLMYTKDEEQPHAKIDHIVQRHKDEKSKEAKMPKSKGKLKEDSVDKASRSKREESASRTSSESKRDRDSADRRSEGDNRKLADTNGDLSSKKKDENRKRLHSDKNRAEGDAEDSLLPGEESEQPLRGVVFVLSGYQNPERARLRDLALSLGASARREWGPRCTHLICAFSRTPKLASVRAAAGGASAAAPGGEWLRECARRRRRLPWQWFAAEPARRVAPPAPRAPVAPPAPDDHSERDTDDEIEEVLRHQKKARIGPSPSPRREPACASPRARGEDVGSGGSDEVEFVRDERMQGDVIVEDSDSEGPEGDTDVEESGPGVAAAAVAAAVLPARLAGCTLVLDAALAAPLDAQLLARYCIAYGGSVLKPSDVDEETGEHYVLCGGEARARGAGAGRRVRADWVWACHAAGGAAPAPLHGYLPPGDAAPTTFV